MICIRFLKFWVDCTIIKELAAILIVAVVFLYKKPVREKNTLKVNVSVDKAIKLMESSIAIWRIDLCFGIMLRGYTTYLQTS